MRGPRLAKLKAMPAWFTLLAVSVVMSSSESAQPAPQAQRQQAVCSLKLRGASRPEALEATVASAELHCKSTSPVSIGVNSSYLGKHVSHFTGVQFISDLACQQQARRWWKSSGGTRPSLLAMLYFCGDYDVTLLQPTVLNLALKQNTSDWFSAVLAFGGSTVAIVRQGNFIGNSAGSTIVAFETAALQVEDHSVFIHNGGLTGAGIKVTGDANLVLRDVTFSYNTATWGGALGCRQNASVSIDSCFFHQNAASRWGGAVDIGCVSGQQATISNSTFTRNSAKFGGAADLHVNTNISIEDSSFTANHAFTSGGGIYLDASSSCTATECMFDRNNASYGGGVYCDDCSIQASRLSFTHNYAANRGGGFCALNQAQATVSNTTFLGNIADYGGAVHFRQNSTISIEGGSFATNHAFTSGGGIDLDTSSAITVTECRFVMNNATYGGAMYCDGCSVQGGRLSFTHNNAVKWGGGFYAGHQAQVTISNTSFQGNSANYGGAACIDPNTTISIETSSFAANHALTSGGGIYLDTSSAFNATECKFVMNKASSGGGICCYGCSVQASRLSFTHNNAVKRGGGFYAGHQAQTTISDTTFQGNSAVYGGAAYLDVNSTISIKGGSFEMNNASNGGGVCCDGCSAQASSLSFTRNKAVNYGGGLYAMNQAQVLMQTNFSNTTFQGNGADYGGAACIDPKTTISIESSSFTDNQASTTGGGIYLDTSSAITATECRFDMNNASNGGGVCCYGCSLQAGSLSFTRNNAVYYGGGLYAMNQAQAAISNTIFQHNSADSGGAAYLDVNTTTSIDHSSITANHALTYGGGIYTSSAVAATECMLDRNHASIGGGVYCDGCSLQAGRLSISHNNANYGGGFEAVNQAQVVMVDSSINSCAAEHGGGVSLEDQSTLHVSGSSFWNNTASSSGGVVEATGQTKLLVANSTFIRNHAGSYGAALSMADSAECFVSHNSSFLDNSATWGGAVGIDNSATLTLSNSSLLNNSADNVGGALYLQSKSVALVTAGSIISANQAKIHSGGGGGICASGNSLITINKGTKVEGNAADAGGGVLATDFAQVIMEGISVSGNQGRTSGGGLYFDSSAHGHLTGCNITFNVAGLIHFESRFSSVVGGGLASLDRTVLTLKDCLVANNTAIGNGGGILLQDTSQLMLLGDTFVTSNHADLGWGGGVSLFSDGFDLDQVSRAVHNNSGQSNVNVQSNVTRLTIVGHNSIYDFANRIDTDKGLLQVVLNVSGYYGLPCQAVQAQAVLKDGTFLGSNVSDENGLVHLEFKVARPPGVYVVSLSSSDAPGVPAANLTLWIRSCIRGEVTPSPVVCQPCQQGFFSFDPNETVCSACPSNANCSGGDVITPLPGYWRSSTDSVQIHRCPNPTACNPAGHLALLACAANRVCGTSMTYKDLQCAPGYHGNVCGLCSPGAGATRLFVCRGCMRSGYIIALYVLAAVVLLCLIKLMCHLNRNQDQTANQVDDQESKVPAAQLLRPLLLYSQYMLVVSSMPVEWPSSIGYPLKVLAWVWSPASPETLSIDCLLPMDTHLPISIQKVLFYVCTPLVILGLLLLVEMAQVQYLRVQHKQVALQVKDLLHSSALVAVFFFYPSILRSLLSMFACIPLDQLAADPYTPAAIGSYWVMDMNQQCFTGYHRAWSLGFGLPCILLVCLGLPLGLLLLMLNKRAYLAEPTTRQHYGFLYMSYRQPMFCWECVVMTQTMVLVAISVFGVNLGVIYQVIVMNAALMLMVIFLLLFKPYAYQQAGKVMLQAVFCLLLTSYTAMTFMQLGSIQPSPEYGMIMGSVVLLVNLVFVVSVVWQMIKLVNWKQMWDFAKRICTKLKCSHDCINRLAVLSVVRCSANQAQVVMASCLQQRIASASETSV